MRADSAAPNGLSIRCQPRRCARPFRCVARLEKQKRRPLKSTAGGGFQPREESAKSRMSIKRWAAKRFSRTGGVCGDGGFGGLASRWRASFATAHGRIALRLGSALNVVVFGLCGSFERHGYDFVVQ